MLFVCRHRVYGVGMFDVAAVLGGDAVVARAGAAGTPVDVLVGTVSACHGAVSLLHLGPALTGCAGRSAGTPGCSIFGVQLEGNRITSRSSRMSRTEELELIIVGAGPAGLCAAMYAGRGMLKAVLLERGVPGGELLNTEWIDDYPGFEHVLGRRAGREDDRPRARSSGPTSGRRTSNRIVRREDGMFEVATTVGHRSTRRPR